MNENEGPGPEPKIDPFARGRLDRPAELAREAVQSYRERELQRERSGGTTAAYERPPHPRLAPQGERDVSPLRAVMITQEARPVGLERQVIEAFEQGPRPVSLNGRVERIEEAVVRLAHAIHMLDQRIDSLATRLAEGLEQLAHETTGSLG